MMEMAGSPNRTANPRGFKGSFPDDLHQTPQLDPAEPEPVPEDEFDQT